MTTATPLPPATRLGHVRLRVRDLDNVLDFYQRVLGLRIIERDGDVASLSASGAAPPLLVLEGRPGAPPRPFRSTGLYHFAILLPDRRALAQALLRLARRRWPLQGASDHLVSEALYLADPEGNGIELYADRPRESWPIRPDGEIAMATEPLDLDGLLREAGPDEGDDAPLHPGAVVGHIHLNVSDLAASEAFYHGVLGFDVTTRSYPGALFLAAGGYHHHIGTNIWAGRGAPRPPEGAAGLVHFEVVIPDDAAREAVLARARSAGAPVEPVNGGVRISDPDGIHVVVRG
ncbi:MAG: VOC family protein [bacterium]|nr:MAG: hypothetical protein DIU52_07365 [bacterium]